MDRARRADAVDHGLETSALVEDGNHGGSVSGPGTAAGCSVSPRAAAEIAATRETGGRAADASTPRDGHGVWRRARVEPSGSVALAAARGCRGARRATSRSRATKRTTRTSRCGSTIARRTIADFVRHSYRTGQFPFLHGWTVLPWFAALGATAYAARAAQCLAFVVGAAATGWAAFRASGDDRRAAAIAAALFATSPLLATYAGMCMLEVPGAAATALTLAVFAEACRASGRRAALWHAATAAAALATYFTKLNYGLWIIPAVGVGYAVRWRLSETRRAALRDASSPRPVLVVLVSGSTSGQRAAQGSCTTWSQAVSVESDRIPVPDSARAISRRTSASRVGLSPPLDVASPCSPRRVRRARDVASARDRRVRQCVAWTRSRRWASAENSLP